MKTYNLITAEQIARLEAQSCRCEDWNNVFVDPEFDTEYVRNVTFSGQIKLGAFKKSLRWQGESGSTAEFSTLPSTMSW